MNRDYIEFMMGHSVSTYHDIRMKGVDFLRNIYAVADLSIKPEEEMSKKNMLKEIIRSFGEDPEQILTEKFLKESNPIELLWGKILRLIC